jgi:multidrug efflux pump
MIAALVHGAVQRRKVVLGITLVATLFGLLAYLTLPRESEPNIDIPFVEVFVPYPGVSPEDAERLLVRPLEVELQSIEGLKEMNAVASQNAAIVVLEFPVNFNKDRVLNDVRAKVDAAKSRFPPDAEEPVVRENNTSQDPVIGVIVGGTAPERTLYQTARRLQDRLESVPGVLRAEMFGGREEMLEVTIDPLRLQAYRISPAEIASVIRANNQLVAAGALRNAAGDFAVKIPGVVEGPDDLLSLPIKTSGDRVVTLGDVAEVRRTYKEAGSATRTDGDPAMVVEVTKRPGANILETVEQVRKVVAEDAESWPSGVRASYLYDESEQIAAMLSLLESGLIIAIILVMIIVVASLGVRAGLLVGAAIPACFLLAFLALQAAGITLNMMVMFGLVLAVGMLVDGSIVVVEYADRKMAEGFDKVEAFKQAGERMFWPVFNGIATTLCAFVPFLFWNEIPGKFMSYLPITLFFVLGASIYIALVFTPALGSLFGKRSGDHAQDEAADLHEAEQGDPRRMRGFMGRYARFVAGAVRRPLSLCAAAVAVIALVVVAFSSTPHRTEFFIEEDPEFVQVYVKARGNLSIEAMNELVGRVEAKLAGVKGVDSTYVRIGRQGGGTMGGAPADSIGRIRLDFVDYEERVALGLTGRDIERAVRERVGEEPGLGIEVRPPQGGPGQGKDLQVEMRGSDVAALDRAAAIVLARMRATGDMVDLEDSRTSPGMEWNFTVDREAAGRYGVSVASVGQAIQFATNGVLVSRFRPDDSEDELDIRVRFPAESRSTAVLDQLTIMTPSGPVPAAYFVERTAAPQVTSINRRDGQRVIVVQGNVKEGVAANQLVAQLRPELQNAGIDPSVRWKFRGADEETQKAQTFFLTAISVALFMMAMILLWQFNSFWGVFCTLFAVVLSTVGVLLGIQVNLFGTFDYISILFTGTGVVALAGVIVGHNIVLVDTYYALRRNQGLDRPEAALRAAVQRFRPVLLTTLTAVVGLLPLMFQVEPNFREGVIHFKPPGSEWWVQMAGAIVWGLSFSTLLTLLFTPVMLAMPSTLRLGAGRLRGRLAALAPRRRRTLAPEPVALPQAAE